MASQEAEIMSDIMSTVDILGAIMLGTLVVTLVVLCVWLVMIVLLEMRKTWKRR